MERVQKKEEQKQVTDQVMSLVQMAKVMGNQAIIQRMGDGKKDEIANNVINKYDDYSQRAGNGMCDTFVANIIILAARDAGITIRYVDNALLNFKEANLGIQENQILFFQKAPSIQLAKYSHVAFCKDNLSKGINQSCVGHNETAFSINQNPYTIMDDGMEITITVYSAPVQDVIDDCFVEELGWGSCCLLA